MAACGSSGSTDPPDKIIKYSFLVFYLSLKEQKETSAKEKRKQERRRFLYSSQSRTAMLHTIIWVRRARSITQKLRGSFQDPMVVNLIAYLQKMERGKLYLHANWCNWCMEKSWYRITSIGFQKKSSGRSPALKVAIWSVLPDGCYHTRESPQPLWNQPRTPQTMDIIGQWSR